MSYHIPTSHHYHLGWVIQRAQAGASRFLYEAQQCGERLLGPEARWASNETSRMSTKHWGHKMSVHCDYM